MNFYKSIFLLLLFLIILLIIVSIIFKLRLSFYVLKNKKRKEYKILLKKYKQEIKKNKLYNTLRIISIIGIIVMILLSMFYVGGFLIILYGIGLLLLLTSFDSKNNHLSDLDELLKDEMFVKTGDLILLVLFIMILIISILSIRKSITIYNEIKK